MELVGDDLRGALHEAARVAAEAGAREVLLSAATRLLADGGELLFEDRGSRELKGLAGKRQVFAVAAPAGGTSILESTSAT